MADPWGFLNFEPATPEECNAARNTGAKTATCNPTNTCDTTKRNEKQNFEPIFGAPKKITDLLGETVMGKDEDVIIQVPVDTFAKPNSVVGIFFSGHWCPPSRQFTPTLIAFYKRFKQKHKDKALEIVFISSDRNQSEFDDYWEEMPWLALSYTKKEERALISKKCGVTGIPTLVILDGGTGDVITKNGRDIPDEDPEGLQYPWKPRPFSQVIREGKLRDNAGKEYTADAAFKDKVIGVFFSGHWCPPSQAFTPKLITAYNKLQKDGKKFQIVFVSWDRSKSEYDDYFSSMPWLALPHGDKRGNELKKIFGITGIPSLIILDDNMKVITKNGTSCVVMDPEGLEFPWHKKPLERLSAGTAVVVNESPTVILIAEKESDVPDIENVLYDLAKEHHDKGEEQDIFFMYITKEKSDAVLGAVVKMCSLNPNASPILLILDLPKRKYYLDMTTSPTSDSARNFVQGYIDGKIRGQQLG